jgi:hypothetical protein
MPESPLYGRRIHISGSIHLDPAVASGKHVEAARDFVKRLIVELLRKGATFVVPVDAEKPREADGYPICFDWLVWETLAAHLAKRPASAVNPLAVAVQHHKNEDQVPTDKAEVWDTLRSSELISIDNASHWNMASKRMEIQAAHGDVLITLGGSEGVLYLANLYHAAGKPVIPLNFKLGVPETGSLKLFSQALIRQQAARFFQCGGAMAAHDWINRLNYSERHENSSRVADVVALLEALERPTVFAVRLLNPKVPDYQEVEDFFTGVVKHVAEQVFRYTLKVVDGKQAYDEPRVDAEIFAKLHRAAVVVADLTGSRPNCFIELGYALGRSISTMITAKAGTHLPFDIESLPAHLWDPSGTLEERREKFLKYWQANINKPPLVTPEPLVP